MAGSDRSPQVPRPDRAVWIAWGLAFVGGVAVLLATVLVLTDPCRHGGTCEAGSWQLASTLVTVGTATAVVGGLAATVLTVRRVAGRDRD